MSNDVIPYKTISMALEEGTLAFFLGAAASLVGADEATRLPDGRKLASILKELAHYPGSETDPLTKIAQYFAESIGDRDLLLSFLQRKFHTDLPPEYTTSFTDFLSDLPLKLFPRLFVSTNYDTPVERVLETRAIPYMCICHMIGKTPYKGRLIVYRSLSKAVTKECIITKRELEECLEDLRDDTGLPVIVYKMHGSAMLRVTAEERQKRNLQWFNSIVLTEQDYIDFLNQDVMERLPTQIEGLLSRSRLLFLGYSLEDWNFRVLLQRLREKHWGSELKHWACLLREDPVEEKFWVRRGVDIYCSSLERFLSKWKENLLGERTMNPFVGLRPFREEEGQFFTGRELVTSYIETRTSINQLTLLFARSGVGKSSFLTTRLIPQFRLGSVAVTYINEWDGVPPDQRVGNAVTQLRSIDDPGPGGHYLVLDQFEDVFKQDVSRKDLWEIFAEIANVELEKFTLLVTMREEWLGAWEEVEQYVPSAFSSMVRLAPLSTSELRRAILRPVDLEGTVRVDPDFPSVLLKDLRQPNAFGLGGGLVEPGLLQLVCQRLWSEAAQSSSRTINQTLYQQLGGADAIIRGFVWKHLRSDTGEGFFDSDQRVLWAGLICHLTVAHGVKATVSSRNIGHKLLMPDLGIAGPAVATGKGRDIARFLSRPVEQRGPVPAGLISWLDGTLNKAHQVGFLKKQQALDVKTGNREVLYELSHDSLDDVLRGFSIEFEKWISRRVHLFLAVLGALFIATPFLVFFFVVYGAQGILILVILGISIGVYLVIGYLLSLLLRYLKEVLYYLIVRHLLRGRLEEPSTQ